jgi:hypothetical protein
VFAETWTFRKRNKSITQTIDKEFERQIRRDMIRNEMFREESRIKYLLIKVEEK